MSALGSSAIRRIALVLAIIAGLGLLIVVGGYVLIGDLFPEEELHDVRPAKVNKIALIDYVPGTAQALNYRSLSGPDTIEYFYFRDSRPAADAFATKFVGTIPAAPSEYPRLYSIGNIDSFEGWPKTPSSGGRRAQRDDPQVQLREIVIVDHPDYSEVWALSSD